MPTIIKNKDEDPQSKCQHAFPGDTSALERLEGSTATLTHVFVLDDAAEVLRVLHEAGQTGVLVRGRRAGTKVHEAQRHGQVVLLTQN